MKKFIQYFRDFHRDYFHPGMYASILLFITALIVFNYSVDFEDGWIDRKWAGTHLRPIFFMMIHGVAYYGSLLIIRMFRKNDVIFTKSFWIKSLVAFAILGVDRSVWLYPHLVKMVPPSTLMFYLQSLTNLASFFTVLLPFFLVKYFFDRSEDFGIYGLTFKRVDWLPYFFMMGIMIIVLFGASYIPEIQDYYPVYKRTGGLRFASYYQIAEGWAKAIFEFCYITDFIYTELFFRGLMVVGFAKLLGKNCVLPMAATYCVLHFGKPVGETISSVFGGYILGVIALYSRNIWGGIFLHGGVAFFMDFFALLRMSDKLN